MGAPKGNKYAVGNNGGRPRKYTSPKALSAECDAYFIDCEAKYKSKKRDTGLKHPITGKAVFEVVQELVQPAKHPTITGLARYLGFSWYDTLHEYEKRKEYSHIMKSAIMRILMGYEEKLVTGRPAGAAFALKNIARNYWQEKSIIDHENLPKNDISVNVIGQPIPFAKNESEIDAKMPDKNDPELEPETDV